MRNLYIDIDGVLLTSKNTTPAMNVVEFINYVTRNFNCYWFTTHCKGDKQKALNYLCKYFDNATLHKMEIIKPTNWITLKTEAIDLSSDFYWLEDSPFQSEIKILEIYKKKDRLILVNLDRPNELLRIVECLEQSISSTTL